jgi:DNA-directed RNA polymerase subunit RPC12/RpoP
LALPELITEYKCNNCKATFGLEYDPDETNDDVPAFCCFCGNAMDYGIAATDDEDEDWDSYDDDDMGDDGW